MLFGHLYPTTSRRKAVRCDRKRVTLHQGIELSSARAAGSRVRLSKYDYQARHAAFLKVNKTNSIELQQFLSEEKEILNISGHAHSLLYDRASHYLQSLQRSAHIVKEQPVLVRRFSI